MKMSTKQERTLRRANSLLASQFLEWTIVSATDRIKRVCFSLVVLLLTFLPPFLEISPFLQLILSSIWKLSGDIQIFYIRIFVLVCLAIDIIYYLSKIYNSMYSHDTYIPRNKIQGGSKEPLAKVDTSNDQLEAMSGPDGFWAVSEQPIISAVIKLEGSPDIKAIREELSKKILSKKQDNGSLKYRKLMMAKAVVNGKLYWKQEEHFLVSNHVYQLQDNIQIDSEETILQQIEPLLDKNFKPNFSPWEVILIKDKKLEKEMCYYMVFRLDHSIADGISLVMLLLGDLAEGLQKNQFSVSSEKVPRISRAGKVLSALKAAVQLPVVFYKYILFDDNNCLHGPVLKGKKMAEVSEAIEIKMIKDIKNQSHTSVSSVLMSCLCGSLYRYFEEHPDATPKKIKAGFPLLLQVPDQDSPLGNYFTVGFSDFSMKEMDPISRLHSTFQSLQCMKTSLTPVISAVTVKYLTVLAPLWLAKKAASQCIATVTVTNVPGPTSPIKLWGDKVTDLYFVAPTVGSSGLTVSILSYMGRMRIGLRADTTVVPTQSHLQNILKGFMHELKLLEAAF